MSTEQTIQNLSAWVNDLSTTVAQLNYRYTDGVKLVMPRSKDVTVTYANDSEAAPEQLPALVVEVETFSFDAVDAAGTFKGRLSARLSLGDEATSNAEAKTKIVRWMDALITHCRKQSSILGAGSKVVPRNGAVTMTRTKGDLNGFEITLDLSIPFNF